MPLLKPPHLALYRKLAADPTKEIIVPQSPEVGDYIARMADFVSAVANAESRSMNEVLNALIFPTADTVRFGYKSPDTRLGTIALPDGMNLYEAALRAISATTYDIIRPERFHARMSNPDAEAYIKSCRMGQTEFSSFIVSCICPVEPDSQLQLSSSEGDDEAIEAPAFGRQVTERLMESLTLINSFVLADQTDRLVNPEPGDITISGNFFESLLGFPVSAEDTSPPAQAGTSCLVPCALLVQCLSYPLAHFKPGTPEAHRWPLHGLRDRFCVQVVVLVRLDVGLYILCRHEPDVMALFPQGTSEVVRPPQASIPIRICSRFAVRTRSCLRKNFFRSTISLRAFSPIT